jgi:hypothetical protein
MGGGKFDLNWRGVHDPTTTDTPTLAIVRDLVERDQSNH